MRWYIPPTRIAGVESWIEPSKDGSVVTVWVVPGSSRSLIDGPHGEALKVRVASPPERGRANRELEELLSEALGVAVEVVAGSTGRSKKILVPGLAPGVVAARLAAAGDW